MFLSDARRIVKWNFEWTFGELECFLFSCLQFKQFRQRHKIISDIISLPNMEQTHHNETTVHLKRDMKLELVS